MKHGDSHLGQFIQLASYWIAWGCQPPRHEWLCGMERTAWNWGLQLTASKEPRPSNNHMSELGKGSFSPSPAFRWQQPQRTTWPESHEKSLARTTQISQSWILNPQKMCEIINVCWLKFWSYLLHRNRQRVHPHLMWVAMGWRVWKVVMTDLLECQAEPRGVIAGMAKVLQRPVTAWLRFVPLNPPCTSSPWPASLGLRLEASFNCLETEPRSKPSSNKNKGVCRRGK